MTKEIYNDEAVYDAEISPLVKQIIEICNKHNIPALMSFADDFSEEKGQGFRSTLLNNFQGRHVEEYEKSGNLLGIKNYLTVVTTTK